MKHIVALILILGAAAPSLAHENSFALDYLSYAILDDTFGEIDTTNNSQAGGEIAFLMCFGQQGEKPHIVQRANGEYYALVEDTLGGLTYRGITKATRYLDTLWIEAEGIQTITCIIARGWMVR